MMIFQILQQT